ncbi:MAG: porin [Planctomycetota bacterium]
MTDRKKTRQGLGGFRTTLAAALAAVAMPALPRAAAAESPFNIDTTNPEEWDPTNLKLDGLIQFRYTANYSPNTTVDNEFTNGFENTRIRLRARWQPHESVRTEVQIDTGANRTDFRLLDAIVEFKLAEGIKVRFGQHRLLYSREYSTSITRQLGMDRTVVDRTLGVLRSEFVNFRFHGDTTRLEFFVHDGSRGATATSFASPLESNIGLAARVEHLVLGDSFRPFRDFSAFRGTEQGLLAGAAASYDDGDNGFADILRLTADLSYENNGTNLHGSFFYRQGLNDPDGPLGLQGTDDPIDIGFVAQGGHFVTDQTEFFGRYSTVIPDPDRTADDTFYEFTAGLNHFIIPESHAFKITAELSYYPTSTTESIVNPSPRVGLVRSDAEQLVARVQIQLQF